MSSSADLHTIPSRSKPRHTISTADLPPPIVITYPACFCGVIFWGLRSIPLRGTEGAEHAVLGAVELEDPLAVKDLPANLAKFYNELDFLPKPKKGNKPKCCTLC